MPCRVDENLFSQRRPLLSAWNERRHFTLRSCVRPSCRWEKRQTADCLPKMIFPRCVCHAVVNDAYIVPGQRGIKRIRISLLVLVPARAGSRDYLYNTMNISVYWHRVVSISAGNIWDCEAHCVLFADRTRLIHVRGSEQFSFWEMPIFSDVTAALDFPWVVRAAHVETACRMRKGLGRVVNVVSRTRLSLNAKMTN